MEQFASKFIKLHPSNSSQTSKHYNGCRMFLNCHETTTKVLEHFEVCCGVSSSEPPLSSSLSFRLIRDERDRILVDPREKYLTIRVLRSLGYNVAIISLEGVRDPLHNEITTPLKKRKISSLWSSPSSSAKGL